MRKSSGFTLIEILIAISIMTVIFSFGLASYASFNRRQITEQAVQLIVSDLRLTQSLATNQEKPSGCSNFRGYSFEVTSSSGSYRIFSLCGTPTDYKSISLKGVTLSGFSKVDFLILSRPPEFTGGRNLMVTESGGSNSKTITVGISGDISAN